MAVTIRVKKDNPQKMGEIYLEIILYDYINIQNRENFQTHR